MLLLWVIVSAAVSDEERRDGVGERTELLGTAGDDDKPLLVLDGGDDRYGANISTSGEVCDDRP